MSTENPEEAHRVAHQEDPVKNGAEAAGEFTGRRKEKVSLKSKDDGKSDKTQKDMNEEKAIEVSKEEPDSLRSSVTLSITSQEKLNKESPKDRCATKMHRLSGASTKSTSVSSSVYEFAEILEGPPKSFHKVVEVHVEGGQPLDLVLSTNLVIRTVSKYSVAFYSVIVGDQILEVNDVVPMSIPEFLSLMHGEQSTLKLLLLRAWNVQPATEARMSWVKKQDNYSYFIVDVYRFKNFRNGFDVKFINKQCHVTRVENNSRGAHAFLKGDRLLDVDSIPITPETDLRFVRRKFNKVMAKQNKCSFLVERSNTLRSSPNPSCFALQRDLNYEEMGDDATEIGCREAMRHQILHTKYRPVSIYGNLVEKSGRLVASMEDGETPKHAWKVKRRIKRTTSDSRRISIDTKAETFRMPSDVKDESLLQRVTPASGLISFVRNYIYH